MWALICSFMVSSYIRRCLQGAVRFEWTTLLMMATGGGIGLMVFVLSTIPKDIDDEDCLH
jgi:hypothetical protein